MKVLLLTARDPLRAADGDAPTTLAAQLAAEDHEVVLVLLEDAVVLARAGHRFADQLAEAASAGVRVLAEEEALARRAVVRPGGEVKPVGMPEVVDLLMEWSDRQAWL